MAPPWLIYPNLSRFSMGWRMGYGESYIDSFFEWFPRLNLNAQNKYTELFPEPKSWLGWYKNDITERIKEKFFDEGVLIWKSNYSVQYVQKELENTRRMEFLFFWGHEKLKDGEITKSCLSQWWKSKFSIDTYTYCCMEQYLMASKARLFNDEKTLEKIMKSSNPKKIKALGRRVKNFKEEIWKDRRYSIIVNGNLSKFLQNQKLLNYLLDTQDKILVEANPYDKIGGVGMAADNNKIINPLNWKGENLIGFALMDVRDELRHICKNYKLLNL
ncbi:MAG: NADAR family protein [Tenericutes bacterium]|nr:NADAR family protein [Mycoplasmatota bacterium]